MDDQFELVSMCGNDENIYFIVTVCTSWSLITGVHGMHLSSRLRTSSGCTHIRKKRAQLLVLQSVQYIFMFRVMITLIKSVIKCHRNKYSTGHFGGNTIMPHTRAQWIKSVTPSCTSRNRFDKGAV